MLQTEVVNKLTAGMAEISAEEASAATAQTTTTTSALQKLLAGVDGNASPVPISHSEVQVATSTTTTMSTTRKTTTTENPEVVHQRELEKEKLIAMKQTIVSKLTAGFIEITEDEVKMATTKTTKTTTTTTKVTTTTINQAAKRLLEGVNEPAPSMLSKGMARKTRTTSTTTVTTTTQTIGAAGRKTLAFISSGTFSLPQHRRLADVMAGSSDNNDDNDDDDSDPNDHEDHTASGGGETAAYFD